jgi:hypothetical protein
MTEVAALGEAAQVENLAAVLEVQPRAMTADDCRRGPVRLHAPAVQHDVTLVRQDTTPEWRIVRLSHTMTAKRTRLGPPGLGVNP